MSICVPKKIKKSVFLCVNLCPQEKFVQLVLSPVACTELVEVKGSWQGMSKGRGNVVTNDPASVAVIGCGYWGKNTSATLSAGLVRNFAQLGALRMVCDATEVGRRRAMELAADCATVADPAEVLVLSLSKYGKRQ